MAKAYDRDGGSGGYTGLRDIYLRHGINLTRYSTHEARKLQGILDTANTQIKSIITKAKGVETKAKYQRIASEIKRVSNDLIEKLDRQLELDFKELAEEETRFVENAFRNVQAVTDFELPSAAKIWATASFGSYAKNGHETFETYLNGLGDDLYKVWDANVRAGYLSGLTAQQINRAVLGSVKDNDPGQMQALRNSLERNTRTMVASLAETARDAVYKENSRLFSGYRYVGTLDSRTCLVCSELDGQKFETLEEAPTLPQHHNCRCLYLPLIKGMEDFDDDDERASEDGPVSANTTYSEWLKTQPDDVVRDILGPTRFEMYKNGTPIEAFVTDGRTLTIEQLFRQDELDNSSTPTTHNMPVDNNGDNFLKRDEEEIARTLQKYEDKIRSLEHEECTVVGLDGKHIKSVVGGYKTVEIPEEARGNIVTHNHPNGGCAFSLGDLKTFVNLDMNEMRCVTENGQMISLKKGNEKVSTEIVAARIKEIPSGSTLSMKVAGIAARKYGNNATREQKARELENIVNTWYTNNAERFGYIFTWSKGNGS